MLKTRILTAAVLIPAVLAALFLLPPQQWGIVTLTLIVVLAAIEWSSLVGFPRWLEVAFVSAMVFAGMELLIDRGGSSSQGWPSEIVFTVCGLAAVFWIAIAPPWVIARWPTQAKAPMAIVGFVVLIGTWMALVQMQARSPWLVLAAMATVWIADTAAYFSGRAFGKHKLAPEVSPGKTWEGVFGAWIAVAVYAALLVPLAAKAGYAGPVTALTIAVWIAFVVALASISVVGDLFESLLKRRAGVKDSGTVLPGHGGVLDRIDALLAAMPIAAVAAEQFLTRS